jgi:hypothetical protein
VVTQFYIFRDDNWIMDGQIDSIVHILVGKTVGDMSVIAWYLSQETPLRRTLHYSLRNGIEYISLKASEDSRDLMVWSQKIVVAGDNAQEIHKLSLEGNTLEQCVEIASPLMVGRVIQGRSTHLLSLARNPDILQNYNFQQMEPGECYVLRQRKNVKKFSLTSDSALDICDELKSTLDQDRFCCVAVVYNGSDSAFIDNRNA